MRKINLVIMVVGVAMFFIGCSDSGGNGGGNPVIEKNWAVVQTDDNPGSLYGHMMCFDSARGKTVLFGGCNFYGTTKYGDTWEWDGDNWTELTPATSPAPRTEGVMAYDASQGVSVLFGGNLGGGDLSNETWTWNGTAWENESTTTAPQARMQSAMAYDSVRHVSVLFGGTNCSYAPTQVLNDTWEYDGIDWVQKSPVHSPPARRHHALAFDSSRNVVVLFGGIDDFGNTTVYYDDTWEWDGTDWTEITPATGSPGATYGHCMCYAASSNASFIFGGRDDAQALLDGTWSWDGEDWSEWNPLEYPGSRVQSAMVYDSTRDKIVLYGGHGSSSNYHDTWEYGD